MTPPNGATGKPGQTSARRPPGGPYKPVVPVIPLPYLRRQNIPSPAPVSAPVVPRGQVRGHAFGNLSRTGTQVEETKREEGQTEEPAVNQVKHVDAATRPPTLAAPAHTAAATTQRAASPPPTVSSINETSGSSPRQSPAASTSLQSQVTSPPPTRRRAPHLFHVVNEGPNSFDHDRHSKPQPNPGRSPETGPDHIHSVPTNQPSLHQKHSSNGSPSFGDFLDSKASSPALHLGGSTQPPAVSFSPYHTSPYDAVPAPPVDGYGRPPLASPSPEGVMPTVAHQRHESHHGPPTFHSFHESQSSIQVDDSIQSSYSQTNGHGPYGVGVTGRTPQPLHSLDPQTGGHFGPVGTRNPGCAVSRIQAQTLDFLRAGIENREFSDCTLELRLVNPSCRQPLHTPLVVPCHQFIISQSPRLKHLLRTREPSTDHRLVIELQDQYIRPDAFEFTLRTLYGWDLGEGPLPAYHPPQGLQDAFELSLAYAAAANYLFLPLVHAKAIRYACHQLQWETIESACQFALSSAIFSRPTQQDGSSSADIMAAWELLDAIVAFLIHGMPLDFILDTSAGDCGFSRLPLMANPVSPSQDLPSALPGTSQPEQRPATSHSRHGSVGQAQMSRRSMANPRLSSIQFGDLSLNGNGTSSDGQNSLSGPVRHPTLADTILSRILLNLPFPMLKQVLEHPALAKPSGELSIARRHDLISTILAEREARRIRSLDRTDPQLQVFVQKLDGAAEPLVVHQLGDFMVNSMGFKEEVLPGDVPYLVQTWVHGSDSINP